jgi:hypothetical protein
LPALRSRRSDGDTVRSVEERLLKLTWQITAPRPADPGQAGLALTPTYRPRHDGEPDRLGRAEGPGAALPTSDCRDVRPSG